MIVQSQLRSIYSDKYERVYLSSESICKLWSTQLHGNSKRATNMGLAKLKKGATLVK